MSNNDVIPPAGQGYKSARGILDLSKKVELPPQDWANGVPSHFQLFGEIEQITAERDALKARVADLEYAIRDDDGAYQVLNTRANETETKLLARIAELESNGFAMVDAPEDTLIECWDNHEQKWITLIFNSAQGWWEFGDERKPFVYFYDFLKWRNLARG